MPELPEVETVRRGLEKSLKPNATIQSIRFLSPGLRQPFPKLLPRDWQGRSLAAIRRRAKYLLFFVGDDVLLSHLGMTGSWRFKSEPMKHDHIEIDLADGRVLVYRDPRRFGQFDVLKTSLWETDRRLKSLGPEPLDEQNFSAESLFRMAQGRSVPIKTFIMDQKIVVGVGNIYASESLYWAKVHPLQLAKDLTLDQAQRLVNAIRDVLQDALAFGGSTISDFRQAGGSAGYFQNQLFVYGAAGELCPICDDTISSTVLAGRSTYWCSKCQPMA